MSREEMIQKLARKVQNWLGFGNWFTNKKDSYFTEKLTNNLTLEMVAIPGGTFTMGSPENEGSDDERPQHNVTLSPFFMGKYPVTQAQWKAIASRTDLKVNIDLDEDPSRFKDPYEGIDRWLRPVECVNWYEAVEFCQRLSKLTGRNYTLPSESQWEYACRAGTTTPYYCGKTITTDLANYNGTNEKYGEYRKQTTPVGHFLANGFGLYDMHGNVWEWCADDWHDNYNDAPNDGSAWMENELSYPVSRSGSWCLDPDACRSAYRSYTYRRDYHDDDNGFRVVCMFWKTL